MTPNPRDVECDCLAGLFGSSNEHVEWCSKMIAARAPPPGPVVEEGRCSMSYRGKGPIPIMFCWTHDRAAKFCFEARP